jgi:hypothetical protein
MSDMLWPAIAGAVIGAAVVALLNRRSPVRRDDDPADTGGIEGLRGHCTAQ